MSWTSDDGGEDSSGSLISSESGFAHTGSIVYNEGGDFIIDPWASF